MIINVYNRFGTIYTRKSKSYAAALNIAKISSDNGDSFEVAIIHNNIAYINNYLEPISEKIIARLTELGFEFSDYRFIEI